MMKIDKKDVEKIVQTIKDMESAQRSGDADSFWEESGLKKMRSKCAISGCIEKNAATRMYAARAWLRGRLHRLNPPQSIRDLQAHYGPERFPWSPEDFAAKSLDMVFEGLGIVPIEEPESIAV